MESKTQSSILRKIRIGMTREEVVAALGKPDDTGGRSRKYRTPSIYKYGEMELYFDPWKEGKLNMVYSEDETGKGHTLLE